MDKTSRDGLANRLAQTLVRVSALQPRVAHGVLALDLRRTTDDLVEATAWMQKADLAENARRARDIDNNLTFAEWRLMVVEEALAHPEPQPKKRDS